MKKGGVVVRRLVPAGQNAPKTVHPTVSPFHHPTPGFEAGDGLGLFTSAKDGGVPPWGVQVRLRWSFGSDVGGEARLVQGLTYLKS